jgi:hypothetical protein
MCYIGPGTWADCVLRVGSRETEMELVVSYKVWNN